MQDMIVFFLGALATALIGMMLSQGLSRKVDLFSMRNLYLSSFIIYQLVSPAMALYYDDYMFFKVDSPVQTGKTYATFAFVYLLIFLLSYHRVKLSPWIAKKGSGPPRDINEQLFLMLGIAIVIIALAIRLYGPYVPVIGKASVQIAVALAAIASSIAGWVWGNRRFNILVTAVTLLIVGGSFGIGMIGSFGRRSILSVLMSFAWGAYHRRFKLMQPSRMLLYMIPILLAVGVVISAFTAIRDNRKTAESDVRETVAKMQQAEVQRGIKDILGGQSCGSAALWAIEQWPDKSEPRYLYSLKYMGYWWVPRHFWPEKPAPLGNDIARLARIPRMNWDLITIPPGVIGYATAEGGILAIVIYALFFGQLLRFFDELIRLNPNNPFVILPAGCATGQVLGLARGGIALFTNLLIIGFLSTYIILSVANKMFGKKAVDPYWSSTPQYR